MADLKIRLNSSKRAPVPNVDLRRTLASLCFRRLVGLCAGLSLRARVRPWCPYLEGHDEMSEMKLGLQVQLDSHVFQTCRGRAKKLQQTRTPVSLCRLVAQGLFSSPLGSDVRKGFSALVKLQGDSKELLRTVSHRDCCASPAETPCSYTQSVSRQCCDLRARNVANTDGCRMRTRAGSWHRGARWLVRARMLSPAPGCPHTTQPMGQQPSPGTPNLTVRWWGLFPISFHSLWILLSIQTQELFLYNLFFGMPLSQLSQPCLATVGNHDKQKVFPTVLHNYLRSKTLCRKEAKQLEILLCHVKRPLKTAGY